MVTNIELAIMAGRSYFDTRKDINRFPVPAGWTEFGHVPNNPDYPTFTGTSGFEAVSFQNQTNPNEIVISYAGTYDTDGNHLDREADIALGAGHYTEQLKEAAEYYLQVKAANPDAKITLTGHSLGAAGAQEAIYSLLMMNNGFICESANIETLDPEFTDMPIVRKRQDNVDINRVMSNSFGFGGTNATLVFQRHDG